MGIAPGCGQVSHVQVREFHRQRKKLEEFSKRNHLSHTRLDVRYCQEKNNSLTLSTEWRWSEVSDQLGHLFQFELLQDFCHRNISTAAREN